MASYRLYQLRIKTNEIMSFQDFEAETDILAMAIVEQRRMFNPMELWSGRRRIRHWEPLPETIRIEF